MFNKQSNLHHSVMELRAVQTVVNDDDEAVMTTFIGSCCNLANVESICFPISIVTHNPNDLGLERLGEE